MVLSKVFKKGKVSSASAGGASFVKIDADSSVDLIILADTSDMLSFNQHAFWRDEGNSPIFPCIGKGCPGCAQGDKAKFKAVLPVLYVGGEKEPVIWTFGITVARMLQDTEDALGSLAGQSIRVKRTGSGLKTRYSVTSLAKKFNISKIKVDWDEIMSRLGPTTAAEIEALLAGDTDDDDDEDPKSAVKRSPFDEAVDDDELEVDIDDEIDEMI